MERVICGMRIRAFIHASVHIQRDTTSNRNGGPSRTEGSNLRPTHAIVRIRRDPKSYKKDSSWMEASALYHTRLQVLMLLQIPVKDTQWWHMSMALPVMHDTGACCPRTPPGGAVGTAT